jgi:hypothetical protein
MRVTCGPSGYTASSFAIPLGNPYAMVTESTLNICSANDYGVDWVSESGPAQIRIALFCETEGDPPRLGLRVRAPRTMISTEAGAAAARHPGPPGQHNSTG